MLSKKILHKKLFIKKIRLLGSLIRILYIEYKNSKTPIFKSFSGICTKFLIKKISTKLYLENTLKNSKIKKKIFIFSNNIAKLYILKTNTLNYTNLKKKNCFYNNFLRNTKKIKTQKTLLR